MSITEHIAKNKSHTTFYQVAGPEDGPLIIFVHGWPELSISWRHQLPVLAALGFRAVAPDMRGYGRSSVYGKHEDYTQELIVGDMLNLLAALNRSQAVWVGHDWGSPVVWNIASHHPDRCLAVASLCVPYYTIERGLDHLLSQINREIYPEKEFPFGQWDYMRHYEENFDEAIAPFDNNVCQVVKMMFRKGNPAFEQKPAFSAFARRYRNLFGPKGVRDLPPDEDIVTKEDLSIYVAALERNGFFGPTSWYMNHAANGAYAQTAQNKGYLDMPALFLNAQYDNICDCTHTRLAEPMRKYCRNLTEVSLRSGHWMAQEKPMEVNAALVKWLATAVPESWPLAK